MADSQADNRDQHTVASEMLREGRYFEETRRWYSFVYLNPLAERFYFIIVGVISLLIFIMSIMALNGLMPLRPSAPFFYSTQNADIEIPVLLKMRESSAQTIDDALLRFYAQQYVEMRESYDPTAFSVQGRFLQNYSDERSFSEYRRLVDPNNPRSVVRRLGRAFVRTIDVQSILFDNPMAPRQATVQFVATEKSKSESRKSYWTATVRFTYSGLELNPAEGSELAQTQVLPGFTVSAYEVKERIRR